MLYLFAIARALEQYKSVILAGQGAYSDHVIDISAPAVDQKFIENMAALNRQAASRQPDRRVPTPTS